MEQVAMCQGCNQPFTTTDDDDREFDVAGSQEFLTGRQQKMILCPGCRAGARARGTQAPRPASPTSPADADPEPPADAGA